jgi:hypothetical protein
MTHAAIYKNRTTQKMDYPQVQRMQQTGGPSVVISPIVPKGPHLHLWYL